MTPEQIERIYMTPRQVADATGHTIVTVNNWIRYRRWLKAIDILGRPHILRSDFREFQKNHPELCVGLLNQDQSGE